MKLFERLPSGWVETSLGDICSLIQYGLNAKANEDTPDGVFFLRISDIGDDGQIVSQGRKYVSISELELSKYRLVDGDLLIARSGSVGRSYVYHYTEKPWVFASYLIRFRPDQSIVLPDYLGFYMKSAFYWRYINTMARTVAQPNINSQELKVLPVPLPPLSEQQEIVKIMREADKIRQLRQQVNNRIRSLSQALFYSTFGDPLSNPRKWPKVQAKDISIKITDGTHQPPKFEDDGEVPFLFVSNIVDGALDLTTERFISSDTYDDLTRSTPIERNDILYSTVGSYGVAVLVNTEKRFAFQRHIAHIKPDARKVNPVFLKEMLNCRYVKAQADRAARGVAQKTINLIEIRRFDLYLPPLDLQEEFATLIEEISSIIEVQWRSHEQITELISSTLSDAFTGNLTAGLRQKERTLLTEEAIERDVALGIARQKQIMIDLEDDEQRNQLTYNIAQQLTTTLTELYDIATDEKSITHQAFPTLTKMAEEVAPALPDKEDRLFILIDSLVQNVQHGLRQQFIEVTEAIKQRILPFYQEDIDTKTVLEMLLKSATKIGTIAPRSPQAARVIRTDGTQTKRIDDRLEKLLAAIEHRPPYFRAFDLVHDGIGLAEATAGLQILESLGFIRRVMWEGNLDAVFRLVDPRNPVDVIDRDSEER